MRKLIKIVFQLVTVCCVACINGNINSSQISSNSYKTFLYVAKNTGTNNVEAFQMGISGDLTSLGSITAPGNLNSLVYVSQGPFLYVGNVSGSVYGYSINRSTGTLTALGGFPVGTGAAVINSICTDPSGKFIYVVNSLTTNNVYGFTVNASTGALSAIAGNPFNFSGTTILKFCAIDPTGQFLYAHNATAGSNNIFAYTINPVTGVLSQEASSPYSLGFSPAHAVIDPSGKFLYVVTSDSTNGVNAYSITPGTGHLTAIGGYAAGSAAKTNISITPSGSYIYVTINLASNNIYGFTYNPITGVPSIINSGAYLGSAGSSASIVSPTIESTGAYIYHLDTGASSAYGFYIDSSTGLLNALSGGAVSMTTNPKQITFARVLQ